MSTMVNNYIRETGLSGIEICDEKIGEYRRKTLQEEQQRGRAKGKT